MKRAFVLLAFLSPFLSPLLSAPAFAEQRSAQPDRAEAVRAKVDAARRELGARAPVEIVEGTFVFTAPPGSDVALRASTSFARSVLGALTTDRFRRLPEKPVSVVLFFSKAPYEKYCKDVLGSPCISRFGFFRHDLRAIVMNAGPGLGTLSHELVHPLVEQDFPQAPTWINEGIASLYEAPALPKPGQIRGVKNWRHPRLLSALKSKTERDNARLDRLFGMSDDTFRGSDEDLNYALARYVCQWLEGQGKLWTFYAKWRDDFANDPSGERAFRHATGKSPRDQHETWAKWASAL